MDELDKNQLQLLKNAFDAFDHEKKGVISTDMIGTILEMLGHELDEDTLKEIIQEIDQDDVIGALLGTNRRQKKKVETKDVKKETSKTTDVKNKNTTKEAATKKETDGSPPETKPSTSTVSSSSTSSTKVVMTL